MNSETKKPLYKVLNEQRTQGEVTVCNNYKGGIADNQDRMFADFTTSRAYENKIPLQEMFANAQYTALAVNNLASLAEALEELFNLLEEHEPQWYLRGHYNRAKEALNRIK